IELVRTRTPRSASTVVALSISAGEEPARMVCPASTRITAGRAGARRGPGGLLSHHTGQFAGQLPPGGAAPTDDHGRQAPLLVGICGGRGRGDSLVDRRPHPLRPRNPLTARGA